MKRENAKIQRLEKEFDTICGGIQPYPDPKEIEEQLRGGKLTKEQAIEMLQKYMDSLEYNGEWLTDCGGIQPLPPLPPKEEEK